MRKILYFVVLVVIVSGCATIESHRDFQQPLEQSLTASIGSSLVRMNRVGDLPNALGGRDIYGGKVDKGYVEVKLLGISDDSELTLSVSDMTKQSTESTMDRYVNPKSVAVSQNISTNTSAEQSVVVKIDGNTEKDYVVGGVKVTFLEIRQSSVVYKVTDLMPIR